jgi:hypothetical protein
MSKHNRELFEQVAEIVKPRRKRVLSPEQRAALVASGEASRFRAPGTQSVRDERQAPISPRGGPLPTEATKGSK